MKKQIGHCQSAMPEMFLTQGKFFFDSYAIALRELRRSLSSANALLNVNAGKSKLAGLPALVL